MERVSNLTLNDFLSTVKDIKLNGREPACEVVGNDYSPVMQPALLVARVATAGPEGVKYSSLDPADRDIIAKGHKLYDGVPASGSDGMVRLSEYAKSATFSIEPDNNIFYRYNHAA